MEARRRREARVTSGGPVRRHLVIRPGGVRKTGTTIDAIRVGWGGPGWAGSGERARVGQGGPGRGSGRGRGGAGGRGCGRGVGRGAGASGGAGGLSGPDPVLHPDRGRMLLLKYRDYIGHCIDQLQIACCRLQPGVGVAPLERPGL